MRVEVSGAGHRLARPWRPRRHEPRLGSARPAAPRALPCRG